MTSKVIQKHNTEIIIQENVQRTVVSMTTSKNAQRNVQEMKQSPKIEEYLGTIIEPSLPLIPRCCHFEKNRHCCYCFYCRYHAACYYCGVRYCKNCRYCRFCCCTFYGSFCQCERCLQCYKFFNNDVTSARTRILLEMSQKLEENDCYSLIK